MVSPEVLRRYSFFKRLDRASLEKLASIAEEVNFQKGDILYGTGQPCEDLILLEEGRVESYLSVDDPAGGKGKQEVFLFELDQREMLSMCALMGRVTQTTTARAVEPGRMIRMCAEELTRLCEADTVLGYALMRDIAETLTERLQTGFFCNRCPRAVADQLEQVRSGTVTGGRVLA